MYDVGFDWEDFYILGFGNENGSGFGSMNSST